MVEFGWTCDDFRLTGHHHRCDIQSRIFRAMEEAEKRLIAICFALQNISADPWLQKVYLSLFGPYEDRRFKKIQSKY